MANYSGWVAVKKITVEKNTRPIDIALFLAGLNETFDRKVEDNLRKVMDLKALDAHLEQVIAKGKKSSDDVARALAEINSSATNKIVNEMVAGASVVKPEGVTGKTLKKEEEALKELVKVYATKKALNALDLRVNYSWAVEKIKPGKKDSGGKAKEIE